MINEIQEKLDSQDKVIHNQENHIKINEIRIKKLYKQIENKNKLLNIRKDAIDWRDERIFDLYDKINKLKNDNFICITFIAIILAILIGAYCSDMVHIKVY
jgi:hypothetical protein